jgi:hypothetical protein
MPAIIKVGIEQIKELINQFNNEEKEELARYLDKITMKDRFEKFLSSKKDIPLTYEEITEEVEKVRSQRYK